MRKHCVRFTLVPLVHACECPLFKSNDNSRCRGVRHSGQAIWVEQPFASCLVVFIFFCHHTDTGVHDLSDDRAFGRDPKGFLERKREARLRGQAGCEAGSNGDCCGRRRYHDAGSNNSSTASTQYPSAGARTSWQASPVSSSSHAAVIDLSYESSGSDVSDGIGGEGSWNGLGRCRAPAAAESGADSPSQASGADPMLSVQTSTREQRFGERPRGKGLRESLENVGGREGSSTAQGGSSSGETRDSREAEGTELIGCPMYANQVRTTICFPFRLKFM